MPWEARSFYAKDHEQTVSGRSPGSWLSRYPSRLPILTDEEQ